MKTLSIKQPYASLIAEGIKDIENRSFRTYFRGTFLIHASMQWHDRLFNGELFTKEQFDSISNNWISKNPELDLMRYLRREKIGLDENLPVSAIIGKVDLIDCVQNHDSVWAEKNSEVNLLDLNAKPIWNWVLANPILFKNPILNVKGKLSFWEYNI